MFRAGVRKKSKADLDGHQPGDHPPLLVYQASSGSQFQHVPLGIRLSSFFSVVRDHSASVILDIRAGISDDISECVFSPFTLLFNLSATFIHSVVEDILIVGIKRTRTAVLRRGSPPISGNKIRKVMLLAFLSWLEILVDCAPVLRMLHRPLRRFRFFGLRVGGRWREC